MSRRIPLIAVLLACLALVGSPSLAEEKALPEYQVKALFLVNFAKYVEWPPGAFATNSPAFIIGITGQSEIGEHLQKAVEGKKACGHPIVVRAIEKEQDLVKCHILFISATEKKHIAKIFSSVNSAPVLTVGETDQFTQRGGIIGFIKKEGKVRLEIDLNAAREAGLEISSRLLSVADNVTGKP